MLFIDGVIEGEHREFIVAIGKAAQVKHDFQTGDQVEGMSEPVPDERMEIANVYKTSKLKTLERYSGKSSDPPPWDGAVPGLEIYRRRGHRRLAARTV